MRDDAVWNESGYFEAPIKQRDNVKIIVPVALCTIVRTNLETFYLEYNGVRLRDIDFTEYMAIRNLARNYKEVTI